MKSLLAIILLVANFSLDDIIGDIYNGLTELSDINYEELQTDLYAIAESPIDLNTTSEEELSQLVFLSPQQIDDILLYAHKHPFESLYELRMIPSLTDYEIRNLLPFVRVGAKAHNDILNAREVFTKAQHEILARVDVRNIEGFEGTDPVYTQTRYRFDYRRRVTFGVQLRRPPGGQAKDLQYGAYLQLRDVAPHLHTLVAGNYQAAFGHGLVFAPVYHSGKSMYIQTTGQSVEGLRYYSSVDGQSLHGAGATLRWEWNKVTRLDVSALYSLQRANDSTWHHIIGANMTVRHKRLEVQLTAAENVWSDSIAPYRNTNYNQHYFRGRNQAIIGASFRYNHGWFDAFGEVATAENYQSPMSNDQSRKAHWGFGTIVGSRFYPTSGISLIALYRYYSPWFDNTLGYAFSESSRLGDENGGYLGFDITRLSHWRFSGYGDVFYFSGPKYGIQDSCTIGYDALAEVQYIREAWQIGLRARAKKKGNNSLYSARLLFDWKRGSWTVQTTADFNLSPIAINSSSLPYGVSLAQDVAYYFVQAPVSIRGRLQFFDAREWANRIYGYEHDVLYANSIPAVYGLGGRAYLCLQWQIISQLTLYFKLSETIYDATWASAHNRPQTRTDIHLLLRAKL